MSNIKYYFSRQSLAMDLTGLGRTLVACLGLNQLINP